MRLFHTYILASISGVLYIGVTGNLEKRLIWHRWSKNPRRFTTRYRIWKLVYCEEYQNVREAIAREKQLKRWRRSKKLWLISRLNPAMNDLAPHLYPNRE